MTNRLVDRAPLTALGLLWPLGLAPGEAPAGRPERTFRVVAANALKRNRQPEEWAGAIGALRPDVLCIAELTPAIAAALDDAGVGSELAHRCDVVQRDPAGTGLWSRWPLSDDRVLHAGHAMPVARIDEVGATVVAVHTFAPASPWKQRVWWRSFDAVESLVRSVEGPLVVAGDFNATAAHGPLRRLVGGSLLRDAHVSAGRPFARTFPAALPVALLDRVLVSPEVAVEAIAEHRAPGSDHRAVTADLAVVCAGHRRGPGGSISAT